MEQTLKELKDLNSHMNGVMNGVPRCPTDMRNSSPALFTLTPGGTDRKTDMHWGTGSPTPRGPAGKWGLSTCTHRVPYQCARLGASQYFLCFTSNWSYSSACLISLIAMINIGFPGSSTFPHPCSWFGHFL